MCGYIESLAIAGDERAIPAIAQYLDLPNLMTSAEVAAHLSDERGTPLSGQYPVCERVRQACEDVGIPKESRAPEN